MVKKGERHSGMGMSKDSWFLHLRRFLLAQPHHRYEDRRGQAYRVSGVFDIGNRFVSSAGYTIKAMAKAGLIRTETTRAGTYAIELTPKGRKFIPNKDIARSALWLWAVKDALAAGTPPPVRDKTYLPMAEGDRMIEEVLAGDRAADVSKPKVPAPPPPTFPPPLEASPDEAAAFIEDVIARYTTEVQQWRDRAELAEKNLQTLIDNLAAEQAEAALAHTVTDNGAVATPFLDRLSAESRAELERLMKSRPGVTT